MKTLIKNCRVISPDVDIPNAIIEIDDSHVTGIHSASSPCPQADNVIDAEGAMAMPGFIDTHFHGALGFDFTDSHPEGVFKIGEVKLREGVTTMLPTTLTLPEDKLADSLKVVAKYMETQPFAKVPGVHLEGPFINCNCIGAQNPAFVRKPDIEEVKRLNEIAKVLLVSFAVEVEGGLEFAKDLSNLNIVSSCGHSAATYAQLKEGVAAGVKRLTHFCNQMTPLHHREIGMVGGGLMNGALFLEVICDKIHLCPDMIDLIFNLKDIEKIVMITDTMCAAWKEPGEYDLGGLAVKVADGVARLVSNNAIAGSTLKYNEGLKNVHEITGLPLSELVKATSYNQARSLGLDKLGKIAPGFFADIVLMDDNFTPQKVLVNGKVKVG